MTPGATADPGAVPPIPMTGGGSEVDGPAIEPAALFLSDPNPVLADALPPSAPCSMVTAMPGATGGTRDCPETPDISGPSDRADRSGTGGAPTVPASWVAVPGAAAAPAATVTGGMACEPVAPAAGGGAVTPMSTASA